MPADSLLDICIRACAKRRAFLPSVGDLPYDLVRPILAKIESPEHLVCSLAISCLLPIHRTNTHL